MNDMKNKMKMEMDKMMDSVKSIKSMMEGGEMKEMENIREDINDLEEDIMEIQRKMQMM